MKTEIKQIQQIVSLLKQFNVRHIVLSPGTRHVPLVHIVESDDFFHCYSIVDERSAAYFALGLSEAINEPVAFSCTSATASCNYMPAMKEAFERNIQLIALTADKQRYLRFHGASQVINQVDMYKPFCKYSIDLPVIKNSSDEWYSNRCINEALLELNHHGKGPVQINFLEPADINELASFKSGDMPVCRKISRIDNWNNLPKWKSELVSKKRILVICGQYIDTDCRLKNGLERFSERYNCVITYDNFSNVTHEKFIPSTLLSTVLNRQEVKKLMPDLIISYGSKSFACLIDNFKDYGVEHWDINPEGRLLDASHSLSRIFECTPEDFFDNITDTNNKSNNEYRLEWLNSLSLRNIDIAGFTNFYAVNKVLNALPSGSNVHASVLNSMKFTNLSTLPDHTLATGNICTDGIDGALSTFIGQSQCFDGLSLLVIGDLSYLYDLNASITKFGSNVRILLINNYAGGEFHFNISKQKIASLDKHIAAGHHTQIADTLNLTNLNYLSARNKEELNNLLPSFLESSDVPILLEVFTDADNDGKALRAIFNSNRQVTLVNRISKLLSSIFGARVKNLIKEKIYG